MVAHNIVVNVFILSEGDTCWWSKHSRVGNVSLRLRIDDDVQKLIHHHYDFFPHSVSGAHPPFTPKTK